MKFSVVIWYPPIQIPFVCEKSLHKLLTRRIASSLSVQIWLQLIFLFLKTRENENQENFYRIFTRRVYSNNIIHTNSFNDDDHYAFGWWCRYGLYLDFNFKKKFVAETHNFKNISFSISWDHIILSLHFQYRQKSTKIY